MSLRANTTIFPVKTCLEHFSVVITAVNHAVQKFNHVVNHDLWCSEDVVFYADPKYGTGKYQEGIST